LKITIEIVDFPINNGESVHSFLLNYQRVFWDEANRSKKGLKFKGADMDYNGYDGFFFFNIQAPNRIFHFLRKNGVSPCISD